MSAAWRVVIIDDSPDDRAEVRRLLLKGSERRYRFAEADTGTRGLDLVRHAREGAPDCVVLDYSLPDMDAPELLASLCGADREPLCPVVVLTGAIGAEMGREVLRAGAQDYIGKDWLTPESLTRAVENGVERWSMLRELRQRKNDLREREEQLAMAFQASSLMYFSWDVVNDRVERRLSRFEALPSTDQGGPTTFAGVIEAVHPDDRQRFRETVEAALVGDGQYRNTYRLLRADGAVLWVEEEGRVSFDAQGRALRLYGVSHDITARRETEIALAEQDKRKDEFLATLAHELRNPLAPIRNGLEILRLSGLPAGPATRARDMMDRQLAHIVRLVDDLLDISRVNRGKITLQRERLTVQSLVVAAVEACRPALDDRRHALSIELPPGNLHVEGDRTRLVQVLANLLTNAAKYSEPGGHVRVTAHGTDAEVVIAVSDTGVGIAPELIPTLWDMFTQVRDTLDKAQGGLGIGLSLVKKLVEMHGGAVTAASDGPGRGSTFTVRLPRVEASEQTSAAADELTHGHTLPPTLSRRILVVDDNFDGAESLALMLGLFGHRAVIAHEGLSAIASARSFRPDLVFLDIGLPGMDGYEVARRLRSDPDTAGTVLIALTGWGRDDDKRRSRAAGFDFHLTKPVEVATVQEVLDRFPPPENAVAPRGAA